MDRCNPPGGGRHLIQDSSSDALMNSVIIGGAALAAAVVVAARPAGSPRQGRTVDTVRVRVFELVDDRGKVRSRISVEPGGEVVFRLLDQDGTIRVKLGGGRDGSGLVLLNDATEPGVHLLAKAAGSTVRVVNKDGRERLLAP
jgi:hypothetical protein